MRRFFAMMMNPFPTLGSFIEIQQQRLDEQSRLHKGYRFSWCGNTINPYGSLYFFHAEGDELDHFEEIYDSSKNGDLSDKELRQLIGEFVDRIIEQESVKPSN